MNPAQYGRNGDSQLVHVRPDELQALGLLAQATGNNLTINPQTGYPEAWALPKWVLPVAAIAATALTAGAAAPAAAGALGASGAAAGAGAAGAAGGAAAAGAGAGALGAGAAGAGLGTAAGGTALGTSGVIGSGMGTSGLLAAGEGASMAGGSAFGTALGNATAGTSSGLLGAGGAIGAEQAAAPIVNQNTAAGMFDKANYGTDGLLGNTVDAYDKYGSTAMKVTNAAQSAMPEPQQPVQAQPLQNAPLNLSGVLSQANEQKLYDEQENMRRRQLMQQYVSQIRGY